MSLPQLHWYDLRTDITATAQAFEEIGLDSAWAFERLLVPEDQSGGHGLYGMPDVPWPEYYRNSPDPLAVLTAAGAVTSRLELGTNVLVAPLHLPVVLANSLASIDRIIGGRLIAGLGTGWSIDEYDASAPRPFAERGAALDEFLDVAEAVWGPDPVKFRNERYTISPSTVGPKPARPIPVVLGGGRGKALDRIARRADGWLPTNLTPAQIGAQLAQLREKAAEYGRDPGAVTCITQVIKRDFSRVTTAGREPYAGDFEQFTEDVAALAEHGVDHVFLASSSAARDRAELVDWAAQFHGAVRAAGL
nr:TIGR03619 family F420-dependent LLM class oxidoreductase [Kineosporia babensis]